MDKGTLMSAGIVGVVVFVLLYFSAKMGVQA